MKRGIEVWSDYDQTGEWCLRIKKHKGKLSLDEITAAAMEYEEDFYAVIIKAISDDMMQYYDDIETGDYITLYSATDFFRREQVHEEQERETAIEAPEKQIPRAPATWGDGYAPDGSEIIDMWECPGCGASYEIDADHYDYCPSCGQHIDWSDEE